MSHRIDDNIHVPPKDLILILALAKHIDAQSQVRPPKIIKKNPDSDITVFAKKIDEDRYAHYAYAVLDPLSSSYSMFKYFFDAFIGGSSDSMHDLILDPVVIAGIVMESLFLVSFSFFAYHFGNLTNNGTGTADRPMYQKWISTAWPYVRDIMKALKNAYRGWRSTLAIFSLLGVDAVNSLVFPLGLIFGLLASVNRFFIRTISDARGVMLEKNKTLLLSLNKITSSFTFEDARRYLNAIQYQSASARYLGFMSSAFGGFIDGLYLYAAAVTLSVLAPPLLIAMASLCAIYTLGCIVTRLYEQYDVQTKLMISQTKCHLAVLTKQMQSSYDAYLSLLQQPGANAETIKMLRAELCDLINQFDAKRCLLEKQTSRTYFSAFLSGINNGLHAYGALSSLLYFVGGIFLVAGVVFPPIITVISISLGVAILLGFLTHSFMTQMKHNEQKEKELEDVTAYPLMNLMKAHLKEFPDEPPLLTTKQLDRSLKDGLVITPPQTFSFQEFSEPFRSLFSGLGKGQKFVSFVENPLQEIGADGHYHDAPVMFILESISAVLFGIILALRAIARNFNHSGSTSCGTARSVDLATSRDSAAKPQEVGSEDRGDQLPDNKTNADSKEETSVHVRLGLFKPLSLVRLGSEESIIRLAEAVSPVRNP